MRIGIDARLRAYRGGGIAEHVRRLLAGLAALAPEEDIVVLEHRRAGAADHPHATHRLWTPPHHRLEGLTLPVELLPARLDLLHAPDVVLPRLWRGAAVVTVHDLAFLRQPAFLTADSQRYYAGVHRSVRAADRVIAVSEHTRAELLTLTDVAPAKVRVVPNAVDPRFRAAGRPAEDAAVLGAYGLSPGFILFVSTIEPRKNVLTLLEALRRLRDGGHDATLVLAGADGWKSAPVYERADALGLDGAARFLGFVPDAHLPALYRTAAVLAHPAHDEGFGMPVAEAMAAGTPVVVADAGSLPELVGPSAPRVPPTDAEGWATALAEVLAEPDAARARADAARQRTAELTPERVAAATLVVYREAHAASEAGG